MKKLKVEYNDVLSHACAEHSEFKQMYKQDGKPMKVNIDYDRIIR